MTAKDFKPGSELVQDARPGFSLGWCRASGEPHHPDSLVGLAEARSPTLRNRGIVDLINPYRTDFAGRSFANFPPGDETSFVRVVGFKGGAEGGESWAAPELVEGLEDGLAVLDEDPGPEGGVGAGHSSPVAVRAGGEREQFGRN